ncbi:MAG: methyl-accepting chemotaxis protein, partial [Gammaproteobacteria bacterium]|nr:methyl-accepting chemotaxis protein [Gammaproteobacteria bacterium]
MRIRLPTLSIFHRLLLAIAGIALAGAITSGYIHYTFTAGLIQASVTTHMDTALDSALSRLRTTYTLPNTHELKTLQSSAAVREYLQAFEGEHLVRRAAVERLFNTRIKSIGATQRSLRLIDVDGEEAVVVADGKRKRRHVGLLESIARDPMQPHLAELFAALRNAEPGKTVVLGPYARIDGGYSVFMGIALMQPDIGGFGGVLASESDLSEFLAYIANLRILGHPVGWVFDQTGRPVSSPAASEDFLDPSNVLFEGAAIPDSGMIRAAEFGPVQPRLVPSADIVDVLRIALSLPPTAYAKQFEQGKQLAVVVLVGVTLFAFVVAFLVSRPIGGPIGTLLRMAEAVTRGEFDARAPTVWRGEFGGLARGFNRMLERLQDSLNEARNHAERAERAQRQTQEQNWIKDGLHRLSEATRGESDIATLCERALAALGEHLGLVAGRCYHVEGEELVSVASYALVDPDDRKHLRIGEGLPGQVA